MSLPQRVRLLREFRRVRLQCIENRARSEAEHPRVPDEVPGLDVFARNIDRRLFDEAIDDIRTVGHRCAKLDVAESRIGARRRNPVGHQLVSPCLLERLRRRIAKCVELRDQVIGWQHQHCGIAAVDCGDRLSCHRDRRCRVATGRLEDKTDRRQVRITGRALHVLTLVDSAEQVVAIGDYQQLGHLGDRR